MNRFNSIFRKVTGAEPKKPPTEAQLSFARDLGIEVKPGMSYDEVSRLISQAKKQRPRPSIQEQQEIEADEREIYGDAIYDEYKKWEKTCDESSGYHLLIFRSGKNIVVDVAELDSADFSDTKKPYVKVSVLLPKRRKDRDLGEYLEWDKEKEIRASAILHCQKIPVPLGDEDIALYENILERGRRYAERFGPG